MAILGWPSDALTPHVRVGTAPLGSTITGRWQGDPLGSVYNHQNENQTDAIAYFTQGTWQINDTWALTLGARYAEDEKEALEAERWLCRTLCRPCRWLLTSNKSFRRQSLYTTWC